MRGDEQEAEEWVRRIDEAEAGFRWPRTRAGPPRAARARAVA